VDSPRPPLVKPTKERFPVPVLDLEKKAWPLHTEILAVTKHWYTWNQQDW